MNSKERMMIALNQGIPDRVPVTVHDWQAYHLKEYMNGMSDIEASKAIGIDAAIVRYPFVFRESDQWRVTCTLTHEPGYDVNHYEIETPEGKLTYSQGFNAVTTWEMDPMIKHDEDIKLLKYRPLPYFEKKEFEKSYDELGDAGIQRSFLCGYQGGCWQEACNLCGTEELILQTFDDPDWVHELMEILMKEKLAFIEESIRGAKLDLVETGGGAGSCTVISPAIHEEFCLPYDKRMHDAIRDCGIKTVYHTCGGMCRISDLIVKNGCDASETLSPAAIGGDISGKEDAQTIVNRFRGNIAMIGGMDQINLLTNGTEQQIRDGVKQAMDWYGGKGFILAACDHFFDAPAENLKIFADEAKKYTY